MIIRTILACAISSIFINQAFSEDITKARVCHELNAINQDLNSYQCHGNKPPKNLRFSTNLATLSHDQDAINKICKKGQFGDGCSNNHLASSLYVATNSLSSISKKQSKAACQYGFVESNKNQIKFFTAPYHC